MSLLIKSFDVIPANTDIENNPQMAEDAFDDVGFVNGADDFRLMVAFNVKIPALFTEKSAIKNVKMSKTYRQRIAAILKVPKVLRYRYFSLWQIIDLVTSYWSSYGGA